MRVSTVKSICDLLFEDLLVKLVNILGQESCDRIKVQDDWKKVLYMKVKGTKKELFLKTIQKYLFFGFDGRYSAKNTRVVLSDILGGKEIVEGRDRRTDGRIR